MLSNLRAASLSKQPKLVPVKMEASPVGTYPWPNQTAHVKSGDPGTPTHLEPACTCEPGDWATRQTTGEIETSKWLTQIAVYSHSKSEATARLSDKISVTKHVMT